jgi:hypothetical protein
MKANLYNRKFLFSFVIILFLTAAKNVKSVDASDFAKVIYKDRAWQLVEISGASKILYRVATDSTNVKDTHLTLNFVKGCKPDPVVMIKKFNAYSPSLNEGLLMLQYKIPDFFENQEIVRTEMSEGDIYAFFKFKELSSEKIYIAKESSRLSIWVPASGDGKVKRSSNFYFSLEGFRAVFLKAKEMCKANS